MFLFKINKILGRIISPGFFNILILRETTQKK